MDGCVVGEGLGVDNRSVRRKCGIHVLGEVPRAVASGRERLYGAGVMKFNNIAIAYLVK